MGCGKISDTCGGKSSYATCVKYQSNVSEYGNLNDCDCHSVEEVISDTINVVDEIYPQVFLEDIGENCLEVEKNKDGYYPIGEVVKALVEKSCTATTEDCNCSQVGSQNTDPCTGIITTNILAGRKAGSGSDSILNTTYANWTALPTITFSDLTFKVPVPGTYKVTIDLGYSNALTTDNCSIGIGVNTNPPLASDPFSQELVDPLLKGGTFHFIVESTSKDDILRPLFKHSNGIIVVRSIKVIYEKV
jgi:hypothetical protein